MKKSHKINILSICNGFWDGPLWDRTFLSQIPSKKFILMKTYFPLFWNGFVKDLKWIWYRNISISDFSFFCSVSGLHKEIVNSVLLQPYPTIEDVITLDVKIERQRKRGLSRVSKPYNWSSSLSYISKIAAKPEEKKDSIKMVVVAKEKQEVEKSQPSIRSYDIKCYKCLRFGHNFSMSWQEDDDCSWIYWSC